MRLLEVSDGAYQDDPDFQAMRTYIDYLYELTSDRGQLSKDELDRKAFAWITLLGREVLDKYIKYTIRVLCLSRTWRGAVTADEFLRVSTQVKLGKVWNTDQREWVDEMEIIEKMLRVKKYSKFANDYRKAVDTVTGNITDARLRDQVFEKCRAIIYGWEEES